MPTHQGDEDIKLAIALQMFGGVRKQLPDGSVKRGDSHIMLVGDPGTNKSGLLKYAKKLAPRSIYTSGKSSSGVGLTAAAVRDDFGGGGWTLEGGAMVRANNGTACIDEFDKMGEEDRGSMFEALAEQEISVSKAGINATLPARTRVLAAANPETGRFDKMAPIAEQINLDPALISRFDLIFIVTDEVDEEKDAEIAEMINTTAKVGGMIARDGHADVDEKEDVEPAIDEEVMRAYVAYARQEYTPVPTDAANERVKEFYVKMRSKGSSEDDPVPVTARKMEALHRLAEASARIRLRTTWRSRTWSGLSTWCGRACRTSVSTRRRASLTRTSWRRGRRRVSATGCIPFGRSSRSWRTSRRGAPRLRRSKRCASASTRLCPRRWRKPSSG